MHHALGTRKRIKKVRRHHHRVGRKILRRRILTLKNPLRLRVRLVLIVLKGQVKGGTGTACRLSWRTAVVLPQQLDGPVYQLVLPATSSFGSEDNGRWPFRPYVQMLASHNVSAGAVITKMQFDTKAKVPRVLFSPAGAVDQNDMETIRNQGKTPAAENAIRLTVYQSDESEGSEPVKRAGVKRDVVVEEPATDGTPQDLVKKWAKKSA
jgi:hypothetical protein